MAEKVLNLRIFPGESGRFDLSLLDVGGQALLVPQFTLFADTAKGRRPEFFASLAPEKANQLFDQCLEVFEALLPAKVQRGKFGAHMKVRLENDGPVTIMLESA